MSALVSIGEACELVTDGTHYTPRNIGVGVPFLTVRDVTDTSLDFTNCSFIDEEAYRVAADGNSAPMAGDILFSKDGTVGKVHVVRDKRPFAVLSSLAILRPRRQTLDAGYLGHVLRSPAVIHDAVKRKTGSAIRRVILSDLKQIRFPLPPIREQRRIAAILDKADALRAKRREALAKLDTLTQSIFLDMFGDPATNQRGLATAQLGTLCRRITDGTHQPPKWSPTGHPFLFVSNVVTGELTFETQRHISDETYVELTRGCPIEVGDVLYSTVGSYGVPAVVRTDRRFAFQRHIAHLKPKSGVLDPEFLRAMLASPGVKRQADRAARGVAQKTLNLSEIRKFLVFRPPLELQWEFSRRLSIARRVQSAQRKELAGLDALFTSLQHRAFRGEL